MNNFWQNLSGFTSGERRGAIVFLILIIALSTFVNYLPEMYEEEPWYVVQDSTTVNQWIQQIQNQQQLNLHRFNPNTTSVDELTGMGIPSSLAISWEKYIDAGGRFYSKPDLKRLYGMTDSLYIKMVPYLIIKSNQNTNSNRSSENKERFPRAEQPLKSFNPATDNYKQLIKCGLSKKVASNIINYRKAGGRFNTKADLKNIYAIDTSLYRKLEAHIQLPETPSPAEIVELDSLELNSATKEELEQIKISKYIIDGIVKYRDLLGGYYSYNQLREVYNMKENQLIVLKEKCWIDSLSIQKINVNRLDAYQLSQHPYISHKIAGKLIKYRNFAEKIDGIEEVATLKILSAEELKRLSPYLAF
ncbi:MAG: helix-hairpin-helix domain-containing protein [Salinivirgaceae bacterium]